MEKTIALMLFCCVAFYQCACPAAMPQTSSDCPDGGAEAEEYFQQGLDHHKARKGKEWDLDKAVEYYEKALALGNAKAALNLGSLYIHDHFGRPDRAGRHEKAVTLFKRAVEMGCPDGYHMLSECSYEGWGMPKSRAMGDKLMRQGAEAGSLRAMANYGAMLYKSRKREEGKHWLRRALDLGFGDAGWYLGGVCGATERNAELIIGALREGAGLGSKKCLHALDTIYATGSYGQKRDLAYANEFSKVAATIDTDEAPVPIDLDRLVPARPVLPYQDSNTE